MKLYQPLPGSLLKTSSSCSVSVHLYWSDCFLLLLRLQVRKLQCRVSVQQSLGPFHTTLLELFSKNLIRISSKSCSTDKYLWPLVRNQCPGSLSVLQIPADIPLQHSGKACKDLRHYFDLIERDWWERLRIKSVNPSYSTKPLSSLRNPLEWAGDQLYLILVYITALSLKNWSLCLFCI